MNTAATKATLLSRIDGLHQIPTIPAVLAPLLRYLQQPVEQLDVQKVTDMIAQDKSLAAQCLQMANSPLFGRWQKVDSLRGAIVGLGFHRISDIAMSCGVLNMMPKDSGGIDPVAFWEHSLGCALVSRHFARKISFPDPSKAYLSGLLHDLGIIVNLWVLPQGIQRSLRARALRGYSSPRSGTIDSRIHPLRKRSSPRREMGPSARPARSRVAAPRLPSNRGIMPDWSLWWNSAICFAA